MVQQNCPFAPGTHRLDEPYPGRPALRAAGPLVLREAPAGGPVAVVTDPELARAVLEHPAIRKDPALAPTAWDPAAAGLEQTAAAALSLTTSDGDVHARLRTAHAPLLSAKRMQARAPAMRAVARDLLAELGPGPVDLVEDFTTRYPLTVVGDLLGVPRALVDEAIPACRAMVIGSDDVGAAFGALNRIAGTAMAHDGLARDLRARLPADVTDAEVPYLLFALLFAGQLTTDAALGFLLARVLTDGFPDDVPALVDDVLRRDPPQPFTLWRFTVAEVELAGTVLPPRTPVLVDLAGVDRELTGAGMAFGHGPHFCVGAQLARVELAAVVDVLRTDFPDARLAVPATTLRRRDPGRIEGSRLTALPVEGLVRGAGRSA